MFSQYFKLNSLVLILVLVLTPFYPLQVRAEDAPEAIPEEAPIEEQTTSGDSTIETGDALAETEIINEVNVNVVEVETVPAEEVVENPQPSPEASAGEAENAPSLDVSIENEALVENESETEAETGENSALTEENAAIDTGNAYAGANVVSVVNLNLIESNGFLILLNNFLESLGHIDLRPLASPETPSDPDPCDLPDCGAITSLKVEAENKAGISNVVIVRSRTGANLAEGSSTLINTGNAYAGANVVNIANTNIIDSNYLLFAFNNFGGWDGDLIFPNADFFSSFFAPFSSAPSTQLSNVNLADVENEVETSAETGENETESDESLIETGDALAGSNVSNIVNANLFNTSTLFVVFRIFGSWNGSVFNAPEGISWFETPSGIQIFSEGAGAFGGGGRMAVATENTTDIANQVRVFALTGENKAGSANGAASINTGNAYAGANVLNVANTNVISSNWIVALINIFGDWNGNVSFGQPDLWVATQVEGPETLNPGSEVTFNTTVANRGDAPASNVVFNGGFELPFIGFNGPDYSEIYSREVGDLDPGETREFSYRAKVSYDLPPGDTLIDHRLEVSASETDGNPDDNIDTVSLLAYRSRPSRRNSNKPPALSVSKTNSASASVSAPGTVDYTIVVENTGGSAYESVLYDTLADEDGNIKAENNWELGEIFPDEEITVTYTAVFNENTASGIYTNSAWVEAQGADSGIATSLVTIVGIEGEVLGESCGLFLDKFMRQGVKNDTEQVKKLQEFLNKEMGANLPVTGFYGPLTSQAVRAFQEKYADEVLAPWDLGGPTGIVYQTTLRWINQLECPSSSIEMPSLIAWSNNPNVPPMPANINSPEPTLTPVSIIENAENPQNTTQANPLTPSTSGFLGFLKNIFK